MMQTHHTLKRTLALVLAVGLLSGCMTGGQSSSPDSTPPIRPSPAAAVPPTTARLPWLSSDTLNQFTCKTLQNYYLAGLLCDPLVALDKDNKPVTRLALAVSVSNTGASYVITLRSDAVCSDGSPLTADDLLYSLELARKSPRFAPGLAGVTQAVAQNDTTVVITLEKPDLLFERSLVFPVVKVDTGEEAIPTGVGRFRANLSANRLERNESYYQPVKNMEQLFLVETDSLEAQSYSLMEGTIDLMFSDLQNELSLGLGASYRQIPLSNLVYLGVNTNLLGTDVRLRQALSGLIRREELARRAYSGFAAVTSLPISPLSAATALSAADLEVNVKRQSDVLEAVGWKADEAGIRHRAASPTQRQTPPVAPEPPSVPPVPGQKNLAALPLDGLELLVNTESAERSTAADMVAAMLREAGLPVTVTALPFAQYQARLTAGEYQLCLAEQRMPYNMDISRLVLPEYSPIPGVPLIPALTTRFDSTRAGRTEQAALETLLREQLPVIPLLFRRGILCFSRDFSVNIVATEQDIFYNINEW
ncbi:MAG: ABC transporter substrate-binding protein [Angelakisella sp.]